MNLAIKIIALSVIFGSISGLLSGYIFLNLYNDENKLIEDFYLTENLVHVSPHSIRKGMDKGDSNFILVDLRSQEEYEREHIIGAINIPAYKDPDTSAYGDVERIVSSFNELKENNPAKDIIVYCYSIPCMTGRKIGKMLVENNIYVKHLGIGWNEWRHFWNLWNHEHEWNKTNVEDYIHEGKEPGIPKTNINSTVCLIENEFGC
ncbi:rhodanese-like domain-containing protein [Candidatus Woesearchaeota archaeon]|nr:rhodanese-like domain-containing protein [Candidatus Woesearchaeota archaeon]